MCEWRTVIPRPYSSGGSVYLGLATDGAGELLAIDVETGQIQWRLPTRENIVTPPLAHDGVLFVSSSDQF